MQTQYPATYAYMLNLIECGKVSDISSFSASQRTDILKLFLAEVTKERFDEINVDHFPDQNLERSAVTFLEPKIRCKAMELMWDKYENELDDIFDAAELQNFKAMGGVSDYAYWRMLDNSERSREVAHINSTIMRVI